MQFLPIFLAVLAGCCVLFFAVPHRRQAEYTVKPRTLAGLYAEFFHDLSDARSTERRVMLLLGVIGVWTSFYPAMAILLLRFVPREPAGAALLIVGGILAIVGALANLAAMLISHMNFAWGASASNLDVRYGLRLIPACQLLCAVASIVLGASETCGTSAARWIIGG